MLQRVVWNRVEFKVSPLGGSDFTDVDDGSFCPNEQAQTPPIRKKCRLDHAWEEPRPLGVTRFPLASFRKTSQTGNWLI